LRRTYISCKEEGTEDEDVVGDSEEETPGRTEAPAPAAAVALIDEENLSEAMTVVSL